MEKIIEKTINNDAVVFTIYSIKDEDLFSNHLDFNEIERDIIIFDFSHIDFISSKVIGILVRFQKTIENKKILISGLNEKMKEAFECMGLSNTFKLL